jgi:predicted PurR-regulated permease PerM
VTDETRPPPRVPGWLDLGAQWSWRLAIIAIAVGAVGYALSYLDLVIVPVIIALFVAAMLEPLRRRLVGWGLKSWLAASLAFVIGLLFILSFLGLAIGQVVSNFDDLSNQASSGVTKVSHWLEKSPLHIKSGGLQKGFDKAVERFKDDPTKALSGTVTVLSTTGGLLAGGILALVVTLFLVVDRDRIWNGVASVSPPERRPDVDRSAQAAWAMLVGYVRVTLLEAVFDSVTIGIAVALFGVPVAFALSALVFLSVFIPILGAILSGLLIVLVALVTKGFGTALALGIIILVVQQFDANVLYPFLTSRRLSIHPLSSLLLVGIGGLVGGIFGAFVAVPFVGMAIAARRAFMGLDPEASPAIPPPRL